MRLEQTREAAQRRGAPVVWSGSHSETPSIFSTTFLTDDEQPAARKKAARTVGSDGRGAQPPAGRAPPCVFCGAGAGVFRPGGAGAAARRRPEPAARRTAAHHAGHVELELLGHRGLAWRLREAGRVGMAAERRGQRHFRWNSRSVWIADPGDLIGAAQWRIYQGAAKEFGYAASDSSPQPHFRSRPQLTRSLPGSSVYLDYTYYINILEDAYGC